MTLLRRLSFALVAFAATGSTVLTAASCVDGGGIDAPNDGVSGTGSGSGPLGAPVMPDAGHDASHAVPFPFEPVATSSAVSKVKNLLTGMPATDAEVKSIEKGLSSDGPTGAVAALKTLIQGWIGPQVAGPLSVQSLTPYQSKMLAFFSNAFQQSQTTTYDLQILNPYLLAYAQEDSLLLADVQQMFALTALQTIAANGGNGSFADVIDTRQFMMTPALASYYAFLDNQIFDDAGNFSDRIITANPAWSFSLTGSPMPIASAVQSMTFYSAAISASNTGVGLSPTDWATCLANQPWVMNISTSPQAYVTSELQYVLSGWQVGESYIGAGTPTAMMCLPNELDYQTYAPSFYLQPADFANWSMVTIRQPNPGEPPTSFYDLGSMRGLPNQELVLYTPRVGYYTTQAFLAGWNTNASNQARVTMNQTMIVGLGRAFDTHNVANVSTINTAAIDAVHAANPACYACHQTLDPMSQFFRQAYSLDYSVQTADAEAALPGQFAFDGVTQGGSLSIYDLGRLIKEHPDFAGAWVQKLCTYATSAVCDVGDPEFQRLVNLFRLSNYNWTTLVTELFSSPIVTYLSETVSSDEQGETFPLTREGHLCTLLSNRLGIPDICGLLPTTTPTGALAQVQALTPAMPSDGYSRGSTLPVLANEPSLFFRSDLENICVNIANAVVDATDGGAYSSGAPNTAITNMVRQLMGLTSDRAGGSGEGPTFILQDHFNKALAQQFDGGIVSAADALRSTFVLACESPYVAGMGQ